MFFLGNTSSHSLLTAVSLSTLSYYTLKTSTIKPPLYTPAPFQLLTLLLFPNTIALFWDLWTNIFVLCLPFTRYVALNCCSLSSDLSVLCNLLDFYKSIALPFCRTSSPLLQNFSFSKNLANVTSLVHLSLLENASIPSSLLQTGSNKYGNVE